MKFGRLALSLLVLACAGWLDSAAFADSHGKFPGKGSLEAYNKSSIISDKARNLARKGDLNGAIKLDREAIQTYQLDSALYHTLAFDLSKLKRFEEAITFETKALKLEPNYINAWCTQGLCFENLGKYDDAEKCYRNANSINNDAETCFYIAGILDLKKQFSQAKTWYGKAKALTKDPEQVAQIDACLKKLQPMLEASH